MATADSLALLLVAAGAMLGLALGTLVHRILLLLEPVTRRTASKLDDAVLHSIRPGLPVALMAVGLWLAVALPVNAFPSPLVRVAFAIALALGTWGVANMLVKFVRAGVARRAERRPQAKVIGAIVAPAIGVLAYGVGGLVVLGTLGIQITPILASLGIGGLALAWALQDTLSNVFAGWWIRASREVRPGHYLRLDDKKLEGYVSSIGWRTTRVRTLGNNTIIVPNGVLGQSVVTNFHLPDPRLAVSVRVDVPFDEDPERVMAILLEEVKAAVPSVPGMLAEPGPAVSLNPGFGANGFEITVGFHVAEYQNQFAAFDQVRRRIASRFWRERIRFAVPTQQPITIEDRRAHWAETRRSGAPRGTRPPRPPGEGAHVGAEPSTAMPTSGDLPAASTQAQPSGGAAGPRTGPP